jgi:hypothetical protein
MNENINLNSFDDSEYWIYKLCHTLPLKILSTVEKIIKKSTKPNITKILKIFTSIHYWSLLRMHTLVLALSVKKPRLNLQN